MWEEIGWPQPEGEQLCCWPGAGLGSRTLDLITSLYCWRLPPGYLALHVMCQVWCCGLSQSINSCHQLWVGGLQRPETITYYSGISLVCWTASVWHCNNTHFMTENKHVTASQSIWNACCGYRLLHNVRNEVTWHCAEFWLCGWAFMFALLIVDYDVSDNKGASLEIWNREHYVFEYIQ